MDLIGLLISVFVWGLVFYVLWWALGKIGLPEPFNKVATVILVLLCVIVLLDLAFGLGAGIPRVKWR